MPIFISYSRRDSDFVRTLHEALLARERQTWVDWEGIAPTADWMNEIHAAIDAAEAVVFVLSPESAASPVCAQELAHALAQNKRLIPILRRMVDPAQVPTALARLNWVYVRDADDFDAAIRTLLAAVDTDLDWVQAHTRLLVRSAEWSRQGRDGSLTLRGADLKAAEQWLALGPTKLPPPTELQTRFIIESRRQATQRRTVLMAGAAVALVVIAVLGTLFLLQRDESARQEAVAVARRLASASERLRVQPPERPPEGNPVELSVQLAAEGLRRVHAVGQYSHEADIALRRALAMLPQRIARLVPTGTPKEFDAIAFAGNGEVVAASRYLSTTAVWGAAGEPVTGVHEGKQTAGGMVLSPDGCCVAVIAPEGAAGSVEVRDARTRALLARPHDIGPFVTGGVALPPGATHLLATTSLHDPKTGIDRELTRLWELPGWREIVRLPLLAWPSFSRDGAYLAALTDGKPVVWSTARLYAGDATPLASLADQAPLAGPPMFSADGKHLALSFGENPTRVGIWTMGDWQQVRMLAHSWPVALGPGGRLLAVAEHQGARVLLRIVDTFDERELAHVVTTSSDPVVSFGLNGQLFAVAFDKGIELLRMRPHGADVMRFVATPNTVALAFGESDDRLSLLERIAAGDTQRFTLQHRSLTGARARGDIELGAATIARFSPDGRWVMLGLGPELRVIDARGGTLHQRAIADGRVQGVALSPDARHLVAATDLKSLQLWRVDSPAPAASAALPGPIASHFAAMATDGQRVVAVTQDPQPRRIGQALDVRTWISPGLAPAASHPLGRNRSGLAAGLCALSDDGSLLAVHTAGSRVTVRQADSGRDIGSVDEAGEEPLCAFSADGRQLAVGAGTLRVWDIGAQTQIAALEGGGESSNGDNRLRALAFSANGHRLAALQRDGTVSVWLLDQGKLLKQACLQLSSEISVEDWARFVGSEPHRAACQTR